MRFARQVVLITGGGTGIGRACALRFAQEGAQVVVCGLEQAKLEESLGAIHSLGASGLAIQADLANQEERAKAVRETLERFGQINVLINNAAITGSAAMYSALDQPITHFQHILNVNLTAAFALSQLVARPMQEQKGGAIINISSVGASVAQRFAAAYCASKAALESLTRSLALEWAEYGIRVNAVAPGDIETEQRAAVVQAQDTKIHLEFRRQATPLGRRGQPSEIADAVAFLASDQAAFITGSVLRIDGGFLLY